MGFGEDGLQINSWKKMYGEPVIRRKVAESRTLYKLLDRGVPQSNEFGEKIRRTRYQLRKLLVGFVESCCHWLSDV